jgi:hypothetical protein
MTESDLPNFPEKEKEEGSITREEMSTSYSKFNTNAWFRKNGFQRPFSVLTSVLWILWIIMSISFFVFVNLFAGASIISLILTIISFHTFAFYSFCSILVP